MPNIDLKVHLFMCDSKGDSIWQSCKILWSGCMTNVRAKLLLYLGFDFIV